MPDSDSYDLIAYDIYTKKEVFHWRNVAAKQGAVYAIGGSLINNDSKLWSVVAIRPMSTPRLQHVDVRRVPRFGLLDNVVKNGEQKVRTVEEIRDGAGTEPTYSIQLGSDFATRIWAKESELELAVM